VNTRDIEAFVAVVETGSIVGASARLHLTQPGISRRLQSLEESLGAVLLDRQSKPLRPSPEGRRVYELGRKVLGAVDELRRGAAPEAEPEGEFRLGVPPFLAEQALTEPLDVLRARYPRLMLRISAAWSPALVPQVEAGALDAAAVMVPDNTTLPAHLTALPLAQSPVAIVASPALKIPRPASGVTLRSLSAHPWVLNQDGCGLRSAMRQAFDDAGLPFVVAVEAFGAELQLSLVARGMGVGLVTPGALARSRYRDALDVLNVPDFDVGLRAYLVHLPRLGALARPVERLRDALTRSLQNGADRL